jgi:hypothetical protein
VRTPTHIVHENPKIPTVKMPCHDNITAEDSSHIWQYISHVMWPFELSVSNNTKCGATEFEIAHALRKWKHVLHILTLFSIRLGASQLVTLH